ncbi:creatininase family protein [Muricauda oceani]|uniref:Creatininase family protein n=1 Tax=Flagellimonas oceani TaxID=2698672 RepID=A0A6G7IXR6_9FLAO|nr:creatininase family protein [Allomuricauda oceani]MBW8244953.1 creatininase family protein [Allomuricauda oceani]QII43345.1 creatininase family protein [Allomuricauda oceani]
MPRPYILAETNWKHLKDESFDLAILPWGATEAHNYHLPYATDVIEGTSIAEESARIAWEQGSKVIVLPNIPFGVNTGQSDIYLDMNLNPSTQFAILKDLITVLDRQGIKKFMILNSHGGNNWKAIIRELGLLFPEMFLCVTNWFKLGNDSGVFEKPGDHADEMETSLILHLTPNLVLPKEDWGEGKELKNKINAFSEGWAWTERPWSKVTQDTGVGDPSKATKEKGETFFNLVCAKMGKLLVDISITDIDDLYQKK